MTLPRVLVVDDKPNFLSLYRKLLADRMEVLTAGSAAEALEILAETQVEVVLSDIRMPGMDGIALLRELKARHPTIEVILVTAHGDIPQAVLAMQEGAYSYLTKPFDPEEALRELEGAVERRRTAMAAGQAPPEQTDAPPTDVNASTPSEGAPTPIELPLREAIEEARHRATRDYLIQVLRAVRGNVTRAAERASMERESFHRLLRRYGLRADDFRDKD
jgi:DNA-binding NtrC family response regulator